MLSQVYLLSFAREEALTQWMRKLNTAMIIAPGGRTSGVREPSAPYLVAKTHRSLTVMWLPPKQPYLNTVHSFQVHLRPLSMLFAPYNIFNCWSCRGIGLRKPPTYFTGTSCLGRFKETPHMFLAHFYLNELVITLDSNRFKEPPHTYSILDGFHVKGTTVLVSVGLRRPRIYFGPPLS